MGDTMEQMTGEEVTVMIDRVSSEYKGQLDDLTAAVGMVMVGRLYGWRVIRLVNSRRHWMHACKLFGDLKLLLPEYGPCTHKSLGLKLIGGPLEYWDYIKGVSKQLPLHDRKKVI